MHELSNKRKEPRFGIASAVLPFLANRANDYQPFQYLIQDISASGVRIAIPSWVVIRDIVYPGDHIQLNVPFEFRERTHDSGVVVWQKWDEALDAQVCGISLDTQSPLTYPVRIALDSKEIQADFHDFAHVEDLLVQVLSDSVLIKHGLRIYLRHLNSYFYRTSQINRQEYLAFRELILNDIYKQVQANYNGLLETYQHVAGAEDIDLAFSRFLDLEELRQLMQPEIYIELFARVLSMEIVDLYLKAIKDLEKKLYLNYNTIVMLYVRHLLHSLDPRATVEMPCLSCSGNESDVL